MDNTWVYLLSDGMSYECAHATVALLFNLLTYFANVKEMLLSPSYLFLLLLRILFWENFKIQMEIMKTKNILHWNYFSFTLLSLVINKLLDLLLFCEKKFGPNIGGTTGTEKLHNIYLVILKRKNTKTTTLLSIFNSSNYVYITNN